MPRSGWDGGAREESRVSIQPRRLPLPSHELLRLQVFVVLLAGRRPGEELAVASQEKGNTEGIKGLVRYPGALSKFRPSVRLVPS